MPDNTNDDIFQSQLNTGTNNTSTTDLLHVLDEQSKYLQSINETLEKLSKNTDRIASQTDARYDNDVDFFSNRRTSTSNRTSATDRTRQAKNKNSDKELNNEVDDIKQTLSKVNKAFDDFLDGFENTFSTQIFGENTLGKTLNAYVEGLAKSLGAEISDLPSMFGKELGNQVKRAVTNQDTNLGKALNPLFDSLNKGKNSIEDYFLKRFEQGANNYQAKHGVVTGESESFVMKTSAEEAQQNPVRFNNRENLEQQISNLNRTEKEANKNRQTQQNTRIISPEASKREEVQSRIRDMQYININTAIIDIDSLQDMKASNFPNDAGDRKSFGDVLNDFLNPENPTTNYTNDTSPNVEGLSSEGIIHDVAETAGNIGDDLGGAALQSGIDLLTSGTLDIGSALAGLTSAIGPVGIALTAVKVGLNLISPALEDFKNSLSEFADTLSSTANRDYEENEQRQKNATERLMADVETIIREPFNILKDAAEEVYQVWDAQLRTINGTQGYTKAELQDLMSAYSSRLQSEGLTYVVSSADITESLAKVLEAGLSGAAAEEFAYIATILNAAIPTQDFFDYADTYVALAGNMIAQGYSEGQALQYANEQLELFASNVLYAKNELAGGFTTGLSNAANLFQQSAQIAQTANATNVAEISSVLTSVSAIVGSLAPDLATSMTDLIVQAATGGNSNELIALRSLAGTGASNTDFLNALVNDPQSVFVQLFNNLADLINTSDDAYMEVAESLSNIFGITTDALRRIDFNYLAKAISEMNISNASLDESLALLASGETTTSAEEERMAQINKYILDEGLAYVMDDAAARSIQEHMWNEQIANDLMDNTYGVELIGSTKELLTSLGNTMGNILSMLSIGGKILHDTGNILKTTAEAITISSDIEDILEEGKVGEGNAEDLNNLVATGNATTLNLTDDLLTIMQNTNSGYANYNGLATSSNLAKSQIASSSNAGTGTYSWGTVSKSTSNAITSLSGGIPTGETVEMPVSTSKSTSTEESLNRLERNFNRFISEENVKSVIEEGGTYEDWAKSARKYGIADLDEALEQLGYSETQARDYFEAMQTQVASEANAAYYERQEEFWDNMEGYMDYLVEWLDEFRLFMQDSIYQEALIDNIYQEALTDNIYQDALKESIYQKALEDDIYSDALVSKIYKTGLVEDLFETSFNKDDFYNQFKHYYADWTDYYIKHIYYDKAYDYSKVASVRASEQSGESDAIYALAKQLTKNTVDLLDPTVQTNALLSQILLCVNAIMQDCNTAYQTTTSSSSSSGSSSTTTQLTLVDTLSGLALGLYNTSST